MIYSQVVDPVLIKALLSQWPLFFILEILIAATVVRIAVEKKNPEIDLTANTIKASIDKDSISV